MKKVLVIASDRNELKGLDESWKKCVSGVGPVMAAVQSVIAIEKYKPDVVVSTGSAGSLGRFRRGDVVSFSSVVTPDQDLTPFRVALGSTIGPDRATLGELFTLDRTSGYVLCSSGKFSSEVLPSHRILKADAADMEAYGVALASRYMGVGFYCVKLITDIVGDKSTVGDVLFSYREGRERVSSFLSSLLLSS